MKKISDRISYLQGLAEGMKLNPDKDSHKLILGILDVLGDVGEAFDELSAAHDELSEYVDSIDEDLADMEACLYDDEDDDAYDADEDADEDEGEDEDEDGFSSLTYTCPSCGKEVDLNADGLAFDGTDLCPECKKPLFPDVMDAEDDEASDDDDEE